MPQSIPIAVYSLDIVSLVWPDSGRTMSVRLAPNKTYRAGTILGEITSTPANARQTLTMSGSPTGGSFTLTYADATTAAIPWNATAAQIRAALGALPTLGAGSVLVTGGPINTSFVTVEFIGLFASIPVATLGKDVSGLTGGSSPDVILASTQTGVAGGRFDTYASGNSNGTQIPRAVLEAGCRTDDKGMVIRGDEARDERGPVMTAAVFFKGDFVIKDLIGLDANALASTSQFARLVQGASATSPEGVISLL